MDKIKIDISRLKSSLDSLKVCIKDCKMNEDEKMHEYIEDACIKRFEYTLETSWKMMKRYLKEQYAKEEKDLTMNNIFRFMESYGFIKSWEVWRMYYDKRNDTSHEYNEQKAKEILNILDDFICDVDFLYANFEKAIGE